MALPSSKLQKHVLAVPLSAQGHLNPLMRFCKLLASHGVLVTFVNVDPVHHRLQHLHHQQAAADEQLPPPPYAPNLRRAHIPIHGLDLANDFRVSLAVLFDAQKSIAAPLEALILELNHQGPPITCIISDFTMTSPTQDVADKLNIPRIVFLPFSASLLLLFHYFLQGEHISASQALDSVFRRAERREVICEGLLGLPTLYNDELPYYKHVVDDTLYMWEFAANACQESLRRARAFVMNSFEDLEGPAFMALSEKLRLPIYGVGPLAESVHKDTFVKERSTSTSLWREDESCILWLDKQPPLSVLYISFGSITLLSLPQFEEFVAGLVSSGHGFLWVMRPDLVDNGEVSSSLVSYVLSRSNGKGYVIEWAPQLHVLSHPSVGGFLTHCGWNSTVEGIAHGVPMLCWPYFADQLLNAKYVVEEWKVGLRFEASKEGAGLVERGEVERVIKALMGAEEGKVLRKNAMRLKEASSESLLPGGTSHNKMLALIKSFCM